MNFPKIIAIGTVVLFAVIAVVGMNKSDDSEEYIEYNPNEFVEIELEPVIQENPPTAIKPKIAEATTAKTEAVKEHAPTFKAEEPTPRIVKNLSDENIPVADRVSELFNTKGSKLPFMKTISYKRKVPWLRGRAAWIIDYAQHFDTSRYFISRGLAKRPDYFYERYAEGDRFNIYDPDVKLGFYLLVDLGRKKMWLYSLDHDKNERILLKTYPIGLGRPDPSSPSGLLTPVGKFSLGNKVAIYKPGMMDYFNHKKTEMIRVFGTRWIPFDEALGETNISGKGFGLHGTPWEEGGTSKKLKDNTEGISAYESDGCIRLKTSDIEELFAIIVGRKGEIEIVQNFFDAKLPGTESNR